MTRLPVGLLLASIVASAPASSARAAADESAVEIRVSGIDNPDLRRFVESEARAVLAASPDALADFARHNGPLLIHVEPLNDALSQADFCSSTDKTFGRYDSRRNRFVVSSRLVDLAWSTRADNNDQFECQHGSYRQTLRATIVHELAHGYDNAAHASRHPQLEELTGGERAWMPFRQNRIKNYNAEGSPDVYEFTNLAEAFAVNLEYYVLDDNYECARPAWADFFDREFAVRRDGAASHTCDDYRMLLLSSHVASDNLRRAVELDPDDIYEVHYLHAASGKGMASRWGHAMLRVVMCAPWQEMGKECLHDPTDDLVLSYRANVADITLNYIRGLFGAYPSQLFVYGYPEIIKEYTRGEFRDLISVPLELSDEQIRRFANVTLDRYWSYQGKYYFFWNHCGTETVTHLAAFLPADEVDAVNARTPRSLLRTLPRSGLADRDLYDRIRHSTTRGVYRVPSKEAEYVEAFESLRQYVLYPYETFERFLAETRVEDRAFMYDGFLGTSEYAEAPAGARAPVVATILHMERMLQTRAMKDLSEEFVRLLREGDPSVRDTVRSAFRQFFDEPWDRVDDGTYGVPSRADVEAYLAEGEPEVRIDAWIAALPRGHEKSGAQFDAQFDAQFGELWTKLKALRALERRLATELATLMVAK